MDSWAPEDMFNRGCKARTLFRPSAYLLHLVTFDTSCTSYALYTSCTTNNLALMIRNVPNLVLEGPDHKAEVGTKHPPEDADDDIYEGEADESSYDVEDAKGESHHSQAHPRTHEADVPLKYKVIGTAGLLIAYVINKMRVNIK